MSGSSCLSGSCEVNKRGNKKKQMNVENLK